MVIRAPFLQYDDLRNQASQFLSEHHPDQSIPVPIEEIVEFGFKMDIVPIPGLQEHFDIVAFISKDLTEIRVDEFVMGYRPNRYRFSLAHELAHRVLHKDIFSEVEFTDIAGWKAAMTDSIPEKEYGLLEWHANCFAGLVLVPPAQLRDVFSGAMEMAAENGIDCDSLDDSSRDVIEEHIARKFCVSAAVCHKRVEKDGLWDT